MTSSEPLPVSVSSGAIRRFFEEISATYDRINTLMTVGLDAWWRKKAARIAASGGGSRWLDICAGTGKMTASLARRAQEPVTLVALDFCGSMLRRMPPVTGKAMVHRCLGDVGSLPFADGSFDLVTVAFATRNLHTDRDQLLHCFREIHRVLRPGGRFLNLETSQPDSIFIRRLYHFAIGLGVRAIGPMVSGSAVPYDYLSSSMQTFYTSEQLAGLLAEAGFREVRWTPMTFGAVAAHLARKDSREVDVQCRKP